MTVEDIHKTYFGKLDYHANNMQQKNNEIIEKGKHAACLVFYSLGSLILPALSVTR